MNPTQPFPSKPRPAFPPPDTILKAPSASPVPRRIGPKRFGHGGDLGDIIYSLPAIKALGGGMLILSPDLSVLDGTGADMPRERASEWTAQFLKPLLLAQEYIADVQYAATNPGCDYNLNLFRMLYKNGTGNHQNLCHSHLTTFQLTPDLAWEKWLHVPPMADPTGKRVVVARSMRYRSETFPWHRVMEKYWDDILFVGLPEEHDDFQRRFGAVDYHPVRDALELAQVIDQAELFIGNASFPYAMAEGLKKTVIQEWKQEFHQAVFHRPGATYVPDWNLVLPTIERAEPKRLHVVPRYQPSDPETQRRIRFAEQSWQALYEKGHLQPVHVWHTERNSCQLGDNRAVPFLKDVLLQGLKQSTHPDDLIFLTNDDTVLLPGVMDAVREMMLSRDFCCSFRMEYKGETTLKVLEAGPKFATHSMGRDLFVFRAGWLREHFSRIPDYLIGTSDWDYFLSAYFRHCVGDKVTQNDIQGINPKVEIPMGHVWHEFHNAWWARPENVKTCPSQVYNKGLTAKAFREHNFNLIVG